LAAEMIAGDVPVAWLVGRPADRNPEVLGLHQRKGADHLTPHAVDGGDRKGAVVRCEALAQDLGFAAGPHSEAACGLGCGNLPHQGCPAANKPVQLAVDSVDFLSQSFETGCVHGATRNGSSADTTFGCPA